MRDLSTYLDAPTPTLEPTELLSPENLIFPAGGIPADGREE